MIISIENSTGIILSDGLSFFYHPIATDFPDVSSMARTIDAMLLMQWTLS